MFWKNSFPNLLSLLNFVISLKKLNHTLKPIVMTIWYNKSEKKILVENVHDRKREIDCYCVNAEMSLNGKIILILSFVIIIGICTAIILSIKIMRARSRLARLAR